MNKTILPTILIATAIAAGALAFAPIDTAQAVHTTIQGTQMNESGVISTDQFSTNLGTDSNTVTSTTDFLVGCVLSNAVVGLSAFIVGDGTFTLSPDIALDSSASVNFAIDANDVFTLGSIGAVDALCTGMTTTAGAIVFG